MSFSQIFCAFIDTLGGPGVRDWVQDLYHCRACDFVWDLGQLGVGSD